MKIDEIKLRVQKYAESLADKIFENSGMLSDLKATAAKYWVRQNMWRLDGILNAFKDQNGEIDVNDAMNYFEDSIFGSDGRVSVNIKELFPDNIGKVFPDKTITFNKDDLRRLLG